MANQVFGFATIEDVTRVIRATKGYEGAGPEPLRSRGRWGGTPRQDPIAVVTFASAVTSGGTGTATLNFDGSTTYSSVGVGRGICLAGVLYDMATVFGNAGYARYIINPTKSVKVKSTGSWSKGANQSVNIWNGTTSPSDTSVTITVFNPILTIATGKYGRADWDDVGAYWELVSAEC